MLVLSACSEPHHTIGAFVSAQGGSSATAGQPSTPTAGEPATVDAGQSGAPPDAAVIDPSACGNALANFGEQCDDGNRDDGDGCSASCVIEEGFLCSAPFGTSVSVNGGFDEGTRAGFATEYTIVEDYDLQLDLGECNTRPDPDQDPVLHPNFVKPEALPWNDVDPTSDGRSLLCNGVVDIAIWLQLLELPPGQHTIGFWLRSWGHGTKAAIQAQLDGVPLAVSVGAKENIWERTILPFAVNVPGTYALKLVDTVDAFGGNDFGIDRIEVYPAQADECAPVP